MISNKLNVLTQDHKSARHEDTSAQTGTDWLPEWKNQSLNSLQM